MTCPWEGLARAPAEFDAVALYFLFEYYRQFRVLRYEGERA